MIALHLLPERNCARCSSEKRKEWGCYAFKNEKGEWENQALIPVMMDGVDQYQCPRRPVKDRPWWFSEILQTYAHYKNGFLPGPGGIDSQPRKLMRLLAIVDSVTAEVENNQSNVSAAQAAKVKGQSGIQKEAPHRPTEPNPTDKR